MILRSLKSVATKALVALGLIAGGADLPAEHPGFSGPKATPMRKARAGAFTRGGLTKPSGKRCTLCGTGGHARFEKHGRPR